MTEPTAGIPRSPTADQLWEMCVRVTDAGTAWFQEIVARDMVTRLGYLVFSVPAVDAHYRKTFEWRIGHAGEPKPPTEADIVQRLSDSAASRGFRIADDVPLGLDSARQAREPTPPMAPQELVEETHHHRDRRNATYSGLAALRLMAALEKPASALLPDRPRLRIADEMGLPGEHDLGQYLAVAIETGDAGALDAINGWMRQFVKPGAKQEDWATILRDYRYTFEALKDLAQEWHLGKDIADLSNQELVKRICAAKLFVGPTLESRRTYLESARAIVAYEYRVSSETIAKRWKQRRSILPVGDKLL